MKATSLTARNREPQPIWPSQMRANPFKIEARPAAKTLKRRGPGTEATQHSLGP